MCFFNLALASTLSRIPGSTRHGPNVVRPEEMNPPTMNIDKLLPQGRRMNRIFRALAAAHDRALCVLLAVEAIGSKPVGLGLGDRVAPILGIPAYLILGHLKKTSLTLHAVSGLKHVGRGLPQEDFESGERMA